MRHVSSLRLAAFIAACCAAAAAQAPGPRDLAAKPRAGAAPAPAVGRYVSAGPRHKALARDAAERAAAEAAGGRVVARYGDRTLYETDAPAAGPALRDDLNVLRLRAGDVDTSGGEPAAPDGKRPARAEPPVRDGLSVVQFVGPVRDEWLEALDRAGYDRVRTVPENGFLVSARAGAAPLAGLPGLQWAGDYRAEWRRDPSLASDKGTFEASVEIVDGPEGARTVRRVTEAVDRVVIGPSHVLGAVLLRVVAGADTLRAVARMKRVVYVGRAAEFRPLDERGDMLAAGLTAAGGAEPLAPGYRDWLRARGLDGPLGVTVDVTDTGFDRGSAADAPGELRDAQGASRVAYVNNFTTDVVGDDRGGHGTINASLVAGAGSPAGVDAGGYSFGLGAAPGARVGATKIFNDVGNFDATTTFSSMIAAAYRAGARISSNSWGSFGNAYTIESQEYDARARDALPDVPGAQPMLFVFAAGNFGTGGTITSPGTAKNAISVGAAENFRPGPEKDGCGSGPKTSDSGLDVAYFSSSGPTYDGQARPDLVAPGTHMVGLASRADGFDGSGVCGLGREKYYPAGQSVYTWSTGTSHATPVVAGGAALVSRRAADLRGGAPSPALVKAWLLNTTRYLDGDRAADDLPGAQQGWGMMDLGRALDDAPRVARDGDEVLRATGDSAALTGVVADASAPVRVTLVWTDAPGSSGFAPQVNDLDLEVTVGGVVYRGNNFRRDVSVAGGDADARNTVEQVWLPAGTAGPFAVRVVASNLTGDGVPGDADATDQDFALVVYNARETRGGVFVPEAVEVEGPGGALAPGGTAQVSVTLRNVSPYASSAADVRLESQTDGVVAAPGPVAVGPVAPGAAARLAPAFSVSAAAGVPCGTLARMALVVRADGAEARIPVGVRVGRVTARRVFGDDFEGGAGGWTHARRKGKDLWAITDARAASGARAWFSPATSKIADTSLESPPVAIPATAVSATLAFSHTYNFEGGGFDGAVLEVSDGGAWVDAGDLITSGGYTGRLSGDFFNPLAGRFGWVNGTVGAFTPVTVDLGAYRGREVRVRFRLVTDLLNAAQGWYVDDVRLEVEEPACGP